MGATRKSGATCKAANCRPFGRRESGTGSTRCCHTYIGTCAKAAYESAETARPLLAGVTGAVLCLRWTNKLWGKSCDKHVVSPDPNLRWPLSSVAPQGSVSNTVLGWPINTDEHRSSRSVTVTTSRLRVITWLKGTAILPRSGIQGSRDTCSTRITYRNYPLTRREKEGLLWRRDRAPLLRKVFCRRRDIACSPVSIFLITKV